MEHYDIKRLKNLLFNRSKTISHVHIFGEDESGRSEIVRQLLHESNEDWICAFGDFLYADGSLRLLLEALATDLKIKTRGDRAEDFIGNVYGQVQWPDENNKKLIIFLDNAQAIVNYPPPSLQCFLDSHKAINDLTIRFVTSAPSCFNQYHTYLSHLPIIEFHISSPSKEFTKQLIVRFNPSISLQFLRFAIDALFMICNSPNMLLAIITDAWNKYKERSNKEKFDTILASECLRQASGSKLGNDMKEQKDIIHSFESMPLAMRYILIAAFCASNNPSQTDSRFFTKNHGRDKRSEKRELRAEENRITKESGPKTAELQRIVCIYETFLQINDAFIRGFDVKNVITSLDSMGLVSITNRNNLDIPKIKCLISLESALKIAGSLKLELRNYLEYAN